MTSGSSRTAEPVGLGSAKRRQRAQPTADAGDHQGDLSPSSLVALPGRARSPGVLGLDRKASQGRPAVLGVPQDANEGRAASAGRKWWTDWRSAIGGDPAAKARTQRPRQPRLLRPTPPRRRMERRSRKPSSTPEADDRSRFLGTGERAPRVRQEAQRRSSSFWVECLALSCVPSNALPHRPETILEFTASSVKDQTSPGSLQ